MPYSQSQAISLIQAAVDNPDAVLAVLGDLDVGVIIPQNILIDSLNTMSTSLSGKTSAIFYSSDPTNIAKSYAAADNTIAIINDTNAGKLLGDPNGIFEDALEAALGSESAKNDLVFGTTTNGVRNADGLWDSVSRDFVDNLNVQSVRTVTDAANPYQVFAQTELDAIFNNSNITEINGVPKGVYQTYHTDALNTFIAQGDSPTVASQKAYKHLNDELVKGTSLNYNSVLDNTFHTKVDPMDAATQADIAKGGAFLKALGWAGLAGDVLGLFVLAKDWKQENTVAGRAEVLTEYTAELGAGFAGGLTASKIAINALSKFGVHGKVVAVILTGAAGVLGAVGAGSAAKAAVDNIFNMGKSLGLTQDLDSEFLSLLGSIIGEDGISSLPAWYLGTQLFFGVTIAAFWDPLVINLDGDASGADITADQTVYFDIDGDGIGEAISWVTGDDGFLVRDLNGNGTIDDITEMFGNDQVDGFTALSALDADSNGVVEGAELAGLQLWQDINQDGISQAGELSDLSAHDILSIDVSNDNYNVEDRECLNVRCA